MAWVTRAQLTALGDASAAALISNPTTSTRAALEMILDALVDDAVASSTVVQNAAAAAVADVVAAGGIHTPKLLSTGDAAAQPDGSYRIETPAAVTNLPSGVGPGLLVREKLRDTYIENGTPSTTYVRRMQESGLLSALWETERRERVVPHALTRPLAASTESTASRSVRIPFSLPVGTKRWRAVFENRNYRTNTSYPGSVTLRTICVGTGSRDAAGALTSSFKPSSAFASGLRIIVRDVAADLGVGYSTVWQATPLDAGVDYMLSFGYQGASTVHLGMAGGWYTSGNPMNAELVADGTAARVNRLPFDVRIEYIDADDTPQDVFIGDSIGAASDSTFSVLEAPPAIAARRTGRALRTHSFGGAAFGEWIGVNWGDPESLKWQEITRYGRAERAIVELGNNDINAGTTLTVLKANFESLVALLLERVSPTVIACTITPRVAWTGTQENLRVLFNEWLRTLPAGISGVADTARAVEDSTGANPLPDFVVSDGIHFTTAGSTALAAEIAAPVSKRSDADAALAAYLAATS